MQFWTRLYPFIRTRAPRRSPMVASVRDNGSKRSDGIGDQPPLRRTISLLVRGPLSPVGCHRVAMVEQQEFPPHRRRKVQS